MIDETLLNSIAKEFYEARVKYSVPGDAGYDKQLAREYIKSGVTMTVCEFLDDKTACVRISERY